jgi:hypothetical protein
MTESKLQAKCVAISLACDILAFKVSAEGRRGLPDLLLIKDGVVVLVEMKTPVGRLSAIQKHTIAKLKEHGANVYVCNSIEQFDTILRKHYGGPAVSD